MSMRSLFTGSPDLFRSYLSLKNLLRCLSIFPYNGPFYFYSCNFEKLHSIVITEYDYIPCVVQYILVAYLTPNSLCLASHSPIFNANPSTSNH